MTASTIAEQGCTPVLLKLWRENDPHARRVSLQLHWMPSLTAAAPTPHMLAELSSFMSEVQTRYPDHGILARRRDFGTLCQPNSLSTGGYVPVSSPWQLARLLSRSVGDQVSQHITHLLLRPGMRPHKIPSPATSLTPASCLVVHVHPSGDDSASGRADAPLAPLQQALLATRARPADTAALMLVHGGSFHLPTPVVLTTRDSGLTIAAAPDTAPTLSGGVPLSCSWSECHGIDGGFVCELSAEQQALLGGKQLLSLFVDGERYFPAQFPSRDRANPLVGGSGYLSCAGAIEAVAGEDAFPGQGPAGLTFADGAIDTKRHV